jgi:hypothetical protein
MKSDVKEYKEILERHGVDQEDHKGEKKGEKKEHKKEDEPKVEHTKGSSAADDAIVDEVDQWAKDNDPAQDVEDQIK